jgi:hypothetical protein
VKHLGLSQIAINFNKENSSSSRLYIYCLWEAGLQQQKGFLRKMGINKGLNNSRESRRVGGVYRSLSRRAVLYNLNIRIK